MKGLSHFLPIVLIVVLAIALRVALLAADAVPFDGDEAVVALMAKHILQKGERPIFFYGQPYSGALDAYLTAGAYALIGPRVLGGRLVQMALFELYVVIVFLLAGRVTGSRWAASASALLVAASTPLLATYTLVSVGGYGESLVLGTLILWLALHVTDDWADHLGAWAALGAASGLAFWVLGIAVMYLLPVAVFILWRDRLGHWRSYGVAFVAFVVFSSPWWFYDFTHGHASVTFFAKTPGLKLDNPLLGLLFSLTVLWGVRFPWQADRSLAPFVVPLVASYTPHSFTLCDPGVLGFARQSQVVLQVDCIRCCSSAGALVWTVKGYLLPLVAVEERCSLPCSWIYSTRTSILARLCWDMEWCSTWSPQGWRRGTPLGRVDHGVQVRAAIASDAALISFLQDCQWYAVTSNLAGDRIASV
jgi:hypothetical protein